MPDENLNEGERLARLVRRIIWIFIMLFVLPAVTFGMLVLVAWVMMSG